MASSSSSIYVLDNQFLLNFVLDLLQSRLESGRLLHILDIGCGVARFTEVLGRELGAKARIVGIDPNADDVRQGTERIGKSDVRNVELKVSGITEFDDGEKYDLVMFTKSLHHCFPLNESISQVHHLLAPNGILLAEETPRGSLPVATLDWFFDRLELLSSAGLLFSSSDIKDGHSHSQSHNHGHSHHHHGHSHNHGSHNHHEGSVDTAVPQPEQQAHHSPSDNKNTHFYNFLQRFIDTTVPRTERWSQTFKHDPQLHEKEEMVAAISNTFGKENTKISENTFLYHFIPYFGLQDTPVGVQILSKLILQELRAAEEGSIAYAGFNIVAEKH